MSIGEDARGGYTHIPELSDLILASVGEINPLLNEVRQVVTEANVYHQLFTTTRSATGRAAEKDTRGETDTPNFERVEVTLYDLFAYPSVTDELLSSSTFQLAPWLRNEVQETFNEALSSEFVVGNGTKQSIGLLNSMSPNTLGASPDLPWGSLHYRDASPNDITYSRLVDLIYALPARYRVAGNCKFFMSTSAIETVRNLLDANNLPIWRQDYGVAGAPMVLLGFPVIEVPAMEGQGYPVLFGDMRQTYAFIRHNNGMRITIDNNITTPGYVKFYIRLQCAGSVMDSRAMVALAA